MDALPFPTCLLSASSWFIYKAGRHSSISAGHQNGLTMESRSARINSRIHDILEGMPGIEIGMLGMTSFLQTNIPAIVSIPQ